MALSQHEQEILAELELSLIAEDPQFGESLSGQRTYARCRRNGRWGVIGYVAGTLVLATFFTSSITLSLLGLTTMIVSSLSVTSSARALKRMRNVSLSHPSVQMG